MKFLQRIIDRLSKKKIPKPRKCRHVWGKRERVYDAGKCILCFASRGYAWEERCELCGEIRRKYEREAGGLGADFLLNREASGSYCIRCGYKKIQELIEQLREFTAKFGVPFRENHKALIVTRHYTATFLWERLKENGFHRIKGSWEELEEILKKGDVISCETVSEQHYGIYNMYLLIKRHEDVCLMGILHVHM